MTDQPGNHFRVSVGGDVSGQLVAGHGNVVSGGGIPPAAAVAGAWLGRPVARDRPVHHSIVAMDVAGSGSRDDQLRLRFRADLRAIVAATLARQPQDMRSVDHDDLGDGLRLIVPATITPRSLLDPFVPNLANALREHRKASSDSARLRLRVAIRMGLLHRDDGGWAGHPLVHCARLLDAQAVRRILDAASGPTWSSWYRRRCTRPWCSTATDWTHPATARSSSTRRKPTHPHGSTYPDTPGHPRSTASTRPIDTSTRPH